ncbi:ThuA domain-containing protein [Mucilaginibacter ginkgonis]|uniref:ThuA domain-containing protein n=1 Tax=Mucilaginibacter ginkgonis TaxID=2682091 RepID=A0A6I4HZP7_9SPHI|nr:ThuA domain-containing protein [Mucilaginibacter ginkgonis]QQL49578.1 ThuA domain-containing protein [Mucilaginibacter ginkgonis]
MKRCIFVGALLICLIGTSYATSVLVFSKTKGFHHASIPAGIEAIYKLGRENNFSVDTTTSADLFTADYLKKYDAVIFLNTTGDVLNDTQQVAFEVYIRNGHGYVGVHAASDTEYGWPWYGKLVGAYFTSHPNQQNATFHITDRNFIATKNLPEHWQRFDELYNFKDIQPDLHVLITIDESTYTGGTNGKFHPMSWYHNYDGGRAFYTALGHTDESYSDPLFLGHLLGGIKYAAKMK